MSYMGENMGKCYYCKRDVIHDNPYDYGAYTKKYDNKTHSWKIKDVWHMSCYWDAMNRFDKRYAELRQINRKEEYRQMSLFD